MKRAVSYFSMFTFLTLAGCATSAREPATSASASATAAPPVCCCGYGPGFRGGRGAATTMPTVAAAPTTRPVGPGYGRGMGRGPAACRGFGGGVAMQRGMPQVMAPIHALLDQHSLVQRSVKEIPGGVETTTTSQTPAVINVIRAHTKQMKERLVSGQPIRMWDPLFVELFRHHDSIKMTVTDVPGGVRVVETSDDPQVTLLIRHYAQKGVSEFVADGYERAHRATPLPAEYVQGSP